MARTRRRRTTRNKLWRRTRNKLWRRTTHTTSWKIASPPTTSLLSSTTTSFNTSWSKTIPTTSFTSWRPIRQQRALHRCRLRRQHAAPTFLWTSTRNTLSSTPLLFAITFPFPRVHHRPLLSSSLLTLRRCPPTSLCVFRHLDYFYHCCPMTISKSSFTHILPLLHCPPF